MSRKKIGELLKVTNVDSLISSEWNRNIPGVENALAIFEKLKKESFESLYDFETKLASVLSSRKRILTDKLSENLLHFEIFSPLLNEMHARKKKDGRFYNWVGSLTRTVGSSLRGDSSHPQEFKNLTEAMKVFEDLYEVDENGIYKIGLGNVLRGIGESISGESITFLRVIKRTVGGMNPFQKEAVDKGKDVNEDLDHLICVSHALMRLFHHHEKPLAAKRYIDYLYSAIFPRFGLFNTSIILETGITEENEISRKKEEEDPSIYDTLFFKGLGRFVFFDKIWSNRGQYGVEKKKEEESSQDIFEEEDEEEKEQGSGGVAKVDEGDYLRECFDVVKRYEPFFMFRHFKEEEEVSGVELEKKSRQELEKIFSAVYLRSYASMNSRSKL